MDADCQLSVVVTSRNDDHAGDLVQRLSLFADALLEQANRYGLCGELILVEWNPPPGPRLPELLQLQNKSERFRIRFIEVPPEVHRELPHSDAIPLFQMIAKNVGIRRARGEFVLATNPDLLFSEELVRLLTVTPLDPGVMYRIDRHDVPAEVPLAASLAERLAWCERHLLRVHRRWGSFPPGASSGAFRLISFLARQMRKGFATLLERTRSGPITARRALRGLRLLVVSGPIAALELFREALLLAARLLDPRPKPHTNGCGDFTLLSRGAWFRLRGYPELPIWSMHIDSLLCYMAVAAGYRERVLRPPAKIFHLEHDSSWVSLSPEDRLQTFIRKPWIDPFLLTDLWKDMYRRRRPLLFNSQSWGYPDRVFPETVLWSGELRPVVPPGSIDTGGESNEI